MYSAMGFGTEHLRALNWPPRMLSYLLKSLREHTHNEKKTVIRIFLDLVYLSDLTAQIRMEKRERSES